MSHPLCYTNHMMKMENEMKNYYIELHATAIKPSAEHYATATCCAHFESAHKPAASEFVKEMKEAIDFYWNQKKRGWFGYRIGKLFVQTGTNEVTSMSPAYFEGHRSESIFEEIDR